MKIANECSTTKCINRNKRHKNFSNKRFYLSSRVVNNINNKIFILC